MPDCPVSIFVWTNFSPKASRLAFTSWLSLGREGPPWERMAPKKKFSWVLKISAIAPGLLRLACTWIEAKRPVAYRASTDSRTLYLSSGWLAFCTNSGSSHSGCSTEGPVISMLVTIMPCRLFRLPASSCSADGSGFAGRAACCAPAAYSFGAANTPSKSRYRRHTGRIIFRPFFMLELDYLDGSNSRHRCTAAFQERAGQAAAPEPL